MHITKQNGCDLLRTGSASDFFIWRRYFGPLYQAGRYTERQYYARKMAKVFVGGWK